MPYRQTVFAQDQIYHVFNRGVAKVPIFFSSRDYVRFLLLTDYYRFSNTPTSFSHLIKLPIEERQPLMDTLHKDNNLQVEILSFCLMPNHFHFLLKQKTEKGITNFMGNIQNSYVKYLNIKKGRTGPLFQSAFKAVRIDTEEQLLHVSRYIHLNPSTGYLIEPENLIEYPWSSLAFYSGNPFNCLKNLSFVNPEMVLSLFKNGEDYKNFVFDQAEYQRELDKIKHLILE